MFDTLQDRLAATFKTLRGKGRLSEADIDATAREIRIALLEADVALPVVKTFIASVKERARGSDVSQALNPAQQVIKIVNDELVGILGGETRRLTFAKRPPTVILLAGLQGAGKTTLAGKLGIWLKAQGNSPMLVAADLQRPNAVNQLQIVGQQAGVKVYAPEPGNGVGDPVAVARTAIEEARRTLHDVVVVDTAGRLGIDAELMKQAADIRDAVDPDEILYVVDAMVGQDAVNTAQAFLDGVGFTGVVLSKLDGDARGGAALSVAQITGRQVVFASNGEKLTDFDVFHPDRMASRILGMGDMLTLIEQAEKAFDADQAMAAAEKLQGGGKSFTLDDFLEQMQAVRKMGSLSKIFGMIPGMGDFKEQIASIDDKDIDRIQAIILSMTPAERADPKLFLLCAVLGLTGWASLCRLLRAETLKLRELDYVQAAHAFGISHSRIMARHIFPNVAHLMLIITVLDFSSLILYEAVLSYVGVGVDPSMNSFGGMINLARNEMSRDPVVWWSFASAFGFMVTLVLAANLFADGVRDAFDPRAGTFRRRALPVRRAAA